jgi:hypothetical protein
MEGNVPNTSEPRNNDHAEDENIDDTDLLMPQLSKTMPTVHCRTF